MQINAEKQVLVQVAWSGFVELQVLFVHKVGQIARKEVLLHEPLIVRSLELQVALIDRRSVAVLFEVHRLVHLELVFVWLDVAVVRQNLHARLVQPFSLDDMVVLGCIDRVVPELEAAGSSLHAALRVDSRLVTLIALLNQMLDLLLDSDEVKGIQFLAETGVLFVAAFFKMD